MKPSEGWTQAEYLARISEHYRESSDGLLGVLDALVHDMHNRLNTTLVAIDMALKDPTAQDSELIDWLVLARQGATDAWEVINAIGEFSSIQHGFQSGHDHEISESN
jgi:hypothetical protein